MRVCALIPAFNEADHVASVVGGARQYVEEVILIDDGSSDGTADAGRKAGAVCLRNEVRQGKGCALRKGIQSLLGRDFTHVLLMDGDGQHDAEDIPSLLNAARETGADLVIGTRRFERGSMPVSRYYSNRLGSKLASWMVGAELHDSQCGFRLVRLDRLRTLRLGAVKYEIEMEMLIKMVAAGHRVAHAPIRTLYEGGRARSKMRPVRDVLRICFWSLAYRYLGA
jgi:glycosyltransferase involved in cell wall biosynthesis